ncbi:UbiA prenyltransferase family protein [Halobellus limi]|uniref:4-hydroxybenzoate polyprenyltransferase n=1 Tax=Halobellus limi TaxID=699433 RepID=A0A1H6AZE3_9EURY|nr:UbiA family prenyltransferase [Halobellus limi]SEG53754.1 4-hydroxybenzoate polyprenyltransferase [Halobellus limi]
MTRVRGGIDALLAYVRPAFMFPAVGMSAYGGALAPAPAFEWPIAALHAGTVGLALFVAHLRDGYVDGHLREEETPRLSVAAFRRSIWAGSAGVVALSGLLAALSGIVPALSTVALLALALLHAPYLDRHPVTVTVDYPVGIGIALIGGHAAQATVPATAAAVAALFVGLLAGIKVGIDRLDEPFDRSIGKRTLPVAFGPERADRIAAGLFLLTAAGTVGVGLSGTAGFLPVTPAPAVGAAFVPAACLLATARLAPERAVRVQMALTYAFAALLFLSACDSGCAGIAVVEGSLDVLGQGGLDALARAIGG